MKIIRVITAIAAAVIAISALAATPRTIRGMVVDQSQQPIDFATIVAIKDTVQIAGTTSSDQGRFSLSLPDSSGYTLIARYVGYSDDKQEITTDCNSYKMILTESSESVGKVVVSSKLIRREADRFVVDVANNPASIGKDGAQVLKSAPGVWMTDDEISVLGQSGTKIYINDRELKMDTEQVIQYISGLNAEDIKSLDIITTAGAEYDADSSGGIIKITLKRKREAGILGYVKMNSEFNEGLQTYKPSANLSYNSEKLTINLTGGYYDEDGDYEVHENSTISNGAGYIKSNSTMPNEERASRASASIIYDPSPRHSMGTEVSYYNTASNSNGSNTNTDMMLGDYRAQSQTTSYGSTPNHHISAAANYIYKVDTIGSTLKLLADYTNYNSSSNTDYETQYTQPIRPDSLYRQRSTTGMQAATAAIDFNKIISAQYTINAGLKHSYNFLDNNSLYSYQKADAWQSLSDYNSSTKYNEHISAVYATASANLGVISAKLGLRGENTLLEDHLNGTSRNYFNVFPSASVNYNITPDMIHILSASYTRSISRPSFWWLQGARQQISEYSYQIGNSELLPSYDNSFYLNYIYGYKYVLGAGYTSVEDGIGQYTMVDAENPEIYYIKPLNFAKQRTAVVYTVLPFQFYKWWGLNLNATYFYRSEQVIEGLEGYNQGSFMTNGSTTFTLHDGLYFDIDFFFMSRAKSANITAAPRYNVNSAIKYQFWEKRLTASVGVQNIFNYQENMQTDAGSTISNMEVFSYPMQRRVTFGLTYNFKAGKQFQSRKVESASTDLQQRFSK